MLDRRVVTGSVPSRRRRTVPWTGRVAAPALVALLRDYCRVAESRIRVLACCLVAMFLGGLLTAAQVGAQASQTRDRVGWNGTRIAFSGVGAQGKANIFSIRSDGMGLKNLTDSGLHAAGPAWSPDSRDLVYSTGTALVRERGGQLRVLARAVYEEGSIRRPSMAEYSPDGTRIAYCMEQTHPDASDRLDAQIVVSRPDGSRPRTIVDVPGVRCDEPPSWSPDGRFIAFVRGTRTPEVSLAGRRPHVFTPHIYVVRPDGSDMVDLTPLAAVAGSPSWLHDGRIMFTKWGDCSTRSNCEDIFTMNADGTDVRRITNPEDHPDTDYVSAEPSPDGRFILATYRTMFSPAGEQEHGFTLLDLDGNEIRTLATTAYVGIDWRPRCSVRGTTGDDLLEGTEGPDLICGLGGDDVIMGLGGDDVIFGHGGHDAIIGGAGRDIVVGHEGRDRCDRDEEDYSRVC